MEMDDRFKHIGKDPRFRELKRRDRKVQIDSRFKGMFKDDKFKVKTMIDKRGRPIQKSNVDHLKRYYDIEDETDEDDDDDTTSKVVEKPKNAIKAKKPIKEVESDESKDSNDSNAEIAEEDDDEGDDAESDDDDDDEEDEVRDIARFGCSSSSDDSEDSDSDVEFDHKWAELDQNVARTEDITSRIAVLNMDWDRIKAIDLLVLLNSFKPDKGVIESVSIYPSEFGKVEMKNENLYGPKELIAETTKTLSKNQESDYHRETLRQYQLKRLRYYYAVLVCDSSETAASIYDNCDGLEYETSSAKLDLRYIPEELVFDQSDSKSFAKDLPNEYKPSIFITTALQQSNVQLTWDETNKDRTALTMRKFDKDKIDSLDMNDFMESSDEEIDQHNPYGDLLEEPKFADNPEDSKPAGDRYKSLLLGLDEEEAAEKEGEDEKGAMEVTWGSSAGLKEKTKELIKQKQDEETLTPWEQYLERKKEKKRVKREQSQLKNSEAGAEDEDTVAFSDDCEEDPDFLKQMGKITQSKKGKRKPQQSVEELEQQEKEKAELSLLMMDEDHKEHFNLKDIQERENMTKRKRRKLRNKKNVPEVEDNFKMDIADNRFKAVYENPAYNIEPSSHEFKKTINMDSLITEKIKRKTSKLDSIETNMTEQMTTEISTEKVQEKSSFSSIDSLIKSVKSKTKLKFDGKKKKLLKK